MHAAVQERLERMKSRRVDLLQVRVTFSRSSLEPSPILMRGIFTQSFYQFHWQDYTDKEYLSALQHMLDMRDEGLIAAIGLCNFDSIRTDEICTILGPGAIVSNQVQV